MANLDKISVAGTEYNVGAESSTLIDVTTQVKNTYSFTNNKMKYTLQIDDWYTDYKSKAATFIMYFNNKNAYFSINAIEKAMFGIAYKIPFTFYKNSQLVMEEVTFEITFMQSIGRLYIDITFEADTSAYLEGTASNDPLTFASVII